jgi:capsular polysaccharide biosynthesis protein
VKLAPASVTEFLQGNDPADLQESGSRVVAISADRVTEVPSLAAIDVDPRVEDAAAERTLRNQASQYVSPAVYAGRFDHGLLLPGFIVATDDGRYITESMRTTTLLPRLGYSPDQDGRIEVADADISAGSVVAIGAQTNDNYYHWLFESLARVALLDEVDGRAWAPYAVPALSAMQIETLALFGVERPELAELDLLRPIRFDTVFFISRGIGNIHSISADAVGALRRASKEISAPPARRIYISRSASRRRRITNESKLVAKLSTYGFEAVQTEHMTVRNQLNLFSEASLVVAPHGAGLANIVFGQPGLKVLEIQPEGQDFSGSALYRFLAAACGHPYGCCVVPQDPDVNLAPDPERVMAALERLIARPQPEPELTPTPGHSLPRGVPSPSAEDRRPDNFEEPRELTITARTGRTWPDLGSVDWEQYDFIDLGSSSGGSARYCESRFGGRGLGIDLDSGKAKRAAENGIDVVRADATQLGLDDAVSFVAMFDFLEHLPSLEVVAQALDQASRAARDFIVIRHPSFEGEGWTEQLGVRQYWWNWQGHRCHLHVSDYCRLFADLGFPSYRIHFVGAITSSEHDSLLPITSPVNSFTYDPRLHGPKPIVEFPHPLWRSQTLFVALRAFELDEWTALTGLP